MNFYDFVEIELPENLKLDGTWLNNKKEYWEIFLQEGLESIPDEKRTWGFDELVDALIAKLCVYDAMLIAAKGSYVAFLGGGFSTSSKTSKINNLPDDTNGDKGGMGDSEEIEDIDPDMMVDPENPFPIVGGDDSENAGGSVKKIITGPTEVEFFDTAEALSDFLSSSKNGKSVLDSMFVGLCGLANKIGIKIPYCNDPRNLYNKRFKVGMSNWHGENNRVKPVSKFSRRKRHGICRH